MFINEYGDKNNPLFLLLAPMMVSGEDLYQLMHPYFKHEYHYIAPDQGGHGKAGAYISADEEYKTLKSFLLDEGCRDIDAICHACCHYDLRKLTKEEQAKLHLDFGEKDFDWKYSKKTIPVYMPEAELVIRPGFQHCGYMAAYPKEYAEEIEAFMRKESK